jgi:phosphoesterase RecJ-like protein
MNANPEIEEILDLMHRRQRFLITSHMDPDGDSIGSQLGLYHALIDSDRQVAVVNQGAMPSKYGFLDPDGIIKYGNEPLGFSPEAVFILECPSFDRIGFVRDLMPESVITINIDHHLDNERYADVNFIDTSSCAAGEVIFYILRQGNYNISAQIAEQLYAAIISDTGNFRFASTTARGMKAAAELIGHGARPKWISENIYSRFSPETIKLLGFTLAGFNTGASGQVGYMQVTREFLRMSHATLENSEGFVDFSLAISGIKMGILFKEINDHEVKVSVRSQDGVDAAAFARRFNGGGHINAAGFTISGQLKDVVQSIVTRATEYVSSG